MTMKHFNSEGTSLVFVFVSVAKVNIFLFSGQNSEEKINKYTLNMQKNTINTFDKCRCILFRNT